MIKKRITGKYHYCLKKKPLLNVNFTLVLYTPISLHVESFFAYQAGLGHVCAACAHRDFVVVYSYYGAVRIIRPANFAEYLLVLC